jgi:hypothetical protein
VLRSFRLAILALGFGACAQFPIPLPVVTPPNLTPSQDQAVRSTLAAATSPSSSVGIPPRPCPEHSARSGPGEKCQPLPCGGQCQEHQRCDETAIVPRCVSR